MTNNIALYFHIPFCVKKCDYCAFYSVANADDSLKNAYFESLLAQIRFFSTEKSVSSVYFGGGTPPTLGIGRLTRLINEVRSRFTLTSDCEITVEVNPKTVSLPDLIALFSCGVNRLSVGIQSADDAILRSVGRIHGFADAVECIENAHIAGFMNVSADLMFALPSQSLQSLKESVERITALGVTHISCYSLQLESGTPLHRRAETLSLPDEELEEAQYDLICALLAEKGFKHYEVSSFCKEGYHSRHNVAYWQRVEYFGFGAAAHSFFNNRRFSSPPDIHAFIESSRISLLAPTDYGASPEIDERESLEESIMLGLRTSFGAEIPPSAHSEAARIASLGYGVFKGGVLSLNSKGFRISNAVIARIIDRV